MRKKVQRQERVEFRMDASLKAQMLLYLFSPLQEEVPYGAVANYITKLIRDDLASKGRLFNDNQHQGTDQEEAIGHVEA